MTESLKKILQHLDPNLKEAYYSDDTLNSIKDAANLGQISDDIAKLNILEEEVMNIILGRAALNDFQKNLKSRLGISETKLLIISKVVNDRVFEPIKHKLNQLPINKPALSFQKLPEKQSTDTQAVPEADTFAKKEITEQPVGIEQPIEIEKPIIIEKTEQPSPPKPSIPEYAFPEPVEIKVAKPINKIGEFKKITTPQTTPSKQEKIRNKLLEAMTKKDASPKIVEEMKSVLKSKQNGKETEEESPRKKIMTEAEPSTILTGKGGKFKSEKPIQKSSAKKPYVLDVKLQEIKKESQEKEIAPEPIQYQKYKKKSPFGEI